MPRKRLEVSQGDKYGRLVIVSEVEPYISPSGKSIRKFLCSCECGTTKAIDLNSLRDGSIQSCGCLKKQMANRNYKKTTQWNKTK